MAKVPNKIIYIFATLLFLSSCQTINHSNNLFKKEDYLENQEQIQEKEAIKEANVPNLDKNKIIDQELAPIILPKPKSKVKTSILKKKMDILDEKKFDFNLIKNLTEANLIKKLGNSDFTKQEGKLKNFQYYFSKCFLDIYLIKKNNDYYVNFIQTRPTKLNGRIEEKECLKEISKKFS